MMVRSMIAGPGPRTRDPGLWTDSGGTGVSPACGSIIRRSAFSSVELLVVMAICAVVLGLLLTAVQRVREAAVRIECQNRLRQIGLAVHCYEADFNRLPNGSSCDIARDEALSDEQATELMAWSGEGASTIFYLLLPYVGELPLYQQGNCTDAAVRATIVDAYLCPANLGMTNQYADLTHQPLYAHCGYMVNRQGNAHGSYAANESIFPLGNILPGSITRTFRDGASNTVMMAERYHVCYTPAHGDRVGWAMPGWGDTSVSSWDWPLFGDNEFASPPFPGFSHRKVAFQTAPNWVGKPLATGCVFEVVQSPHLGIMLVGLGDGSVRSVAHSMSIATWVSACRPADGSVPGHDW